MSTLFYERYPRKKFIRSSGPASIKIVRKIIHSASARLSSRSRANLLNGERVIAIYRCGIRGGTIAGSLRNFICEDRD